MKKINLKEIARLTDTSSSTVSKVLNHCGGVDSATRERIFKTADIFPKTKSECEYCDLYLITPEVPSFFWKDRIYQELLNVDPSFRCKYNIYTSLRNAVVLRYLKEAEQLRAKAVIAICDPDSEIRAELEKLAGNALVILLSEYANITNTFYVGSDAERDGFIIGKRFSDLADGRAVILMRSENHNCRARVSGFLKGAALKDAIKIELPAYNKMFPAKTAALLSGLPYAERYSVYSSDGILEEIELAAKKAGIYEKSTFFGHDLRRRSEQSRIVAVVNQRVERQVKTAVNIAEEYLKSGLCPTEKNIIIPSELTVYE